MRSWHIFFAAFTHLSAFITSPALGQDETLIVGEVRAIVLPFEIKSILNGSDEVVNLNVEGPRTVIMTGMAPGRTNIIVLGSRDHRLDFSLSILADQRDLVYVHEGAKNRSVFRCADRCEREGTENQNPSNSDGLNPTGVKDLTAR